MKQRLLMTVLLAVSLSTTASIAQSQTNRKPLHLIESGGVFYFSKADCMHGRELWRSDGTQQGTYMVKDIDPGTGSSAPENIVSMNGIIYFTATQPSTGRELWRSDGTPEGTTLVKDLAPGSTGSNPFDLRVVLGKLYCGANNNEVWLSDGSSNGTVRIVQGARVNQFRAYKDRVLISTAGPLYSSDGTPTGTIMLANVNTNFFNAIYNFMEYGDWLYFVGNSFDLWRTDGTPGNTTRVYTRNFLWCLQVVNGKLLFTHYTDTGIEYWQLPGHGQSPTIVRDVCPGSCQSVHGPQETGCIYNDQLFVALNDGVHGSELWKTDGTSLGTTMVKDIWPGSSGGRPLEITVWQNSMYFSASDPDHGVGLWKSDGTELGTQRIMSFPHVTPWGVRPPIINQMWPTSGALFFMVHVDASNTNELWKTDGTPTGTVRLHNDVYLGDYANHEYNNFNHKHFGPDGAHNLYHNRPLYRNGSIYFVGHDAVGNTHLYSSDGSLQGTTVLATLSTIPSPALPVLVTPSPAVSPGGALHTIYLGYGPQSVTLTASGGVSYQWNPATWLSNPNGPVTSMSPQAEGSYTYTASVVDEFGCTTQSSVTIHVINVYSSINQNLITICKNGNTLNVNPHAVPMLIQHAGASLGPCPAKSVVRDETNPGELALKQNFPNPFNPSTGIEFTLPQASHVRLRVYDALGAEIAALVDELLPAGTHRAVFDATALPSGTYLCRLDAAGASLTRVMTLLK